MVRLQEQAQEPKRPSGPFRLNDEIIAEIEKNWIRVDQIELKQITPLDLSFLESPINVIPSNGISYPNDRLNQLLAQCPQRPQTANVNLYSGSSPQHFISPPRPFTAPAQELGTLMETSPKLDTKLLAVIKGIGHPDRLVSHASLNEISDILDSPEKQAVLRDYDEIYIQSVLEQFKVNLITY